MTEAGGAFSFAVVCEAQGDQKVACGLAERVLVDEIDWIDEDQVEGLCQWQGVDGASSHITWKAVSGELRRRGLVSHGGFRSDPGALDERRARKALRLFASLALPPDAVLLVRDTDDVEGRVDSLQRARDTTKKFPVILATPHTKMECWVLGGFDPRGSDEEAVLEELRSELGFDPRLRAENLTAEARKGKRNAKNVLDRLTGQDPERAEVCWRETDLGVLRERGEGTGLAAYFEELRERWIPVVNGSSVGRRPPKAVRRS